jgi:hypothetical protein
MLAASARRAGSASASLAMASDTAYAGDGTGKVPPPSCRSVEPGGRPSVRRMEGVSRLTLAPPPRILQPGTGNARDGVSKVDRPPPCEERDARSEGGEGRSAAPVVLAQMVPDRRLQVPRNLAKASAR